MVFNPTDPREPATLVDALLSEQRDLTAVERFARWHESSHISAATAYRHLIPLAKPRPGEQYAFEVDLDKCSGCKSCVAACHSLNGLDENETWRGVGLLISATKSEREPKSEGRNSESGFRASLGSRISDFGFQQHVTTACHHCIDPACLNGCPVLAYDKDPLTGIVRHLDDQCIGCQYCVFMCPYEVPQYSERRGIVRKCDLCHQRLAHGEAPACVQACPNEAIRITVVEQNGLQEGYRGKSETRSPKSERSPGSEIRASRVEDPDFSAPASRETRRNAVFPLPSEGRGIEGEGCSPGLGMAGGALGIDAATPHPGPLPSEGRGNQRAVPAWSWRVASGFGLRGFFGSRPSAFGLRSSFGTRNSDFGFNPFLPASPDPAITLPSTRYVSAKPLPAQLISGDAHEARLQPAHLPLAWMLVLTQLGAGGFAVLPMTFRAAQPILAMVAGTATLLGLAGSILHLGRPMKAWRAFLGLRRSWLSREIVVFALFAMLASASTWALRSFDAADRSADFQSAVSRSSNPQSARSSRAAGAESRPAEWNSAIRQIEHFHYRNEATLWLPALLWTTALVGIAGVFCSAMVYHATRRECWRGANSIGRFLGTSIVLGLAAAWFAARPAGAVFAGALAAAMLVKLSRELAFLRLCPDDADLNDEVPSSPTARSAFLMRFRLGPMLRLRFACGWLGGVVLAAIGLLPSPAGSWLAVTALLLCVIGELLERILFFRAVVAPGMPGSVGA